MTQTYFQKNIKNIREADVAIEVGISLERFPDKYKSNKRIVLNAISMNPYDLDYAADDLKQDKEFILKAMEIEGLSLSGASETLRADKEVVIAAVTNNGCAIQFADPSLQGNYEVAKIAISNDPFSLVFAKSLQGDKNFILDEVKKNGLILNYASKELQADTEVALAAVQNNGHALAFVSDENLVNKKIVQAALLNKSDAIKNARDWADIKYRQLDHQQQYRRPTVADNKEHTKIVTLLNSLAEKILEQEKAVAMYDSPFF